MAAFLFASPRADDLLMGSDQGVSKTVDETTQIAAQAGARKNVARPRAGRRGETNPQTDAPQPLDVWLEGLRPEAVAVIAARTALRVAPLLSRDTRPPPSAEGVSALLALRHAVFRASALARVAAKYPAAANGLNATALIAAARAAAARSAVAAQGFAHWGAFIAAPALAAAADAAEAAATPALARAPASADAAGPFAIPLAAPGRPSFLAAYVTADGAVRTAVRFDAAAEPRLGVPGLADSPLWPQGPADWTEAAWRGLKLAFPPDEGWDVWIDWYEDRMRGGSRGEAHELVFVSAPLDVWDEGPAAANAWIKEHLPKASAGPRRLKASKLLSRRV